MCHAYVTLTVETFTICFEGLLSEEVCLVSKWNLYKNQTHLYFFIKEKGCDAKDEQHDVTAGIRLA